MIKNKSLMILVLGILGLITLSIYLFFTNFELLQKNNYKNWSNNFQNQKYVIVIEGNNLTAENELAYRMQIAAKRLGWEAYVVNGSIDLDKNELDRVSRINPDFIITNSIHNIKNTTKHGFKRYIFLTGSGEFLFDHRNKHKSSALKDEYKNLILFDGMLNSFSDTTLFKKYYRNKGLKFYNVKFFPYVQQTNPNFNLDRFNEPKLFYCGVNWDALRNSDKYKQFYNMLDRTGYTDIYGPYNSWNFLSNSWKGTIETDGYAFLARLAKYNVTLLLHSDMHLAEGIPSSRIFEAAAAGTVIISDKNKFVQKYFGNSVLYIDTNASAEEMFVQLEKHIEWLGKHPNQAMKLAEKAHKIFLNKFTLEKNLMAIAKMHEDIIFNN